MEQPHHILFLQGPPSFFFWRDLAAAFEAKGHSTTKINFSLAEAIYWSRSGGVTYRGRLRDWKTYLTNFIRDRGITDIIYYADRLPYHAVAAQVASDLGIRAIAVENGYLRPDWLTLERGGMSAFSHFPNTPDLVRVVAAQVPPPDLTPRFRHTFFAEAASEVIYHLTNYFLCWTYPHYRAEFYYNPVVGYLSHLFRLIGEKRRVRSAERSVGEWLADRRPFFLYALQLQNDYQIQANSQYSDIRTALDDVMRSFAAHAPADCRLLVKVHPMDNGREKWPRAVRHLAETHGLEERVVTIEGGDLGALVAQARGCVVINSTVGIHTIRAGCPTMVLGVAVYDIAGLTHRGSLDTFWQRPDPVDPALSDDFVRAIAGAIQVKGSFYDRSGRAAAIDEIVRRIANQRVNEPDAYVPVPPRLARLTELRTGVEGRP